MLPYAGISFLCLRYSSNLPNKQRFISKYLKIIVTKLKQILNPQVILNLFVSSANLSCFAILEGQWKERFKGKADKNKRTSETLCNKISIHNPRHLKPLSDLQFGHYLAGLIDGDGHFSTQKQLIIVFNELDSSLAYFIKSKIGYGNIYKVKNKKAVIFVLSKKEGLLKVLN